jgi:hypothetical protein
MTIPQSATHYALTQSGHPVFYRNIFEDGYEFMATRYGDMWYSVDGKPVFELVEIEESK